MTGLPASLVAVLAAHLPGPIRRVEPVGGGCIARAGRLETGEAVYFLKWGEASVARTFPAEAAGLRALRAAGSPLHVPEAMAAEPGGPGRPGFLLMEWIEEGRPGPGFWEAFGRGLAALHRHTGPRYGFDQDNFIGRLPQSNTWHDCWPAFFQAERLEPQVARARASGRWSHDWEAPLERLYARLDELLPSTPPPSVLHGDLWSGNALVAADGTAALIDPATYYGHRETDLAMTELFGGFEAGFYEAYREAWPLEPGYEARREVYNLYHLINHLNHFGSGYAGSVASVLRRFG
ncbi:fructosamine kinase [Rhodothermaceae bacterium RA]|nr:fructosamine kinase [Rhodothermaceae bacterium RA]